MYGAGEPPLSEDAPTGATNPYGRTKLMIDQLLPVAAQVTLRQIVGEDEDEIGFLSGREALK